MFNKFKNFFKLSNWKRWTISSISLVSMSLAIILGSIYSVNNKPNSSYKSGAEIVLKITDLDDTAEVIQRQTKQRLELSLPSNSSYDVILNSNDYLTIRGTNIENDQQMNDFKSFIFNKKAPIVTTVGLGPDGKPQELNNIIFTNAEMTSGKINVTIQSPLTYENEFLIWKDLHGLIELANSKYNDEWTSTNVNRDPYKFLFIDGRTEDAENGFKAILKTKEYGGFNAIDYLISKNAGTDLASKSFALNFSFAPKITMTQKEKIFYNLDFSVSQYNLNLQTYNFFNPKLGSNAYQFLIIASSLALSFVGIFLIVNYGLLGGLSVICAAFLIFLGLLMITVFRGEYTPETIAALMIAIGIGLDFNILFFERLKKELKIGNSLQKSLKKADKLTFNSSLTKALALILASAIIYVIGSLYLGTFSILVLLLSIFISVIMFVLIRILANLIIGTKYFDDKLKWLGIYKKIEKTSQVETNSSIINNEEIEIAPNTEGETEVFSKKIVIGKKVSVIILGFIACLGTVLFSTFTLLSSSWLSGMNANNALTSPTVLKTTNYLNKTEALEVKKILANDLGVDEGDISLQLVDKINKKYLLELSTTKKIEDLKLVQINNSLTKFNVQLINYSIIAHEANKTILNVIYIVLAMILAMALFVLFRSDWSYALSIMIALIIAAFLFFILFTFQVFAFNTFFAFSFVLAMLIAISNNITILFRFKEKLKNKKMEELTKVELKRISDITIKDSWLRLLISNGIIMATLLIFTCIPGAMNWSFTLPLMLFILMSLVISIVILPFFFVSLKAIKCRIRRNKILNDYWETEVVKEQIFPNINDIK